MRHALASHRSSVGLGRARGRRGRRATFPTAAIRLVIPWPPGASADAFLRTIADQAGKRLGQTVVPDNKPGANGTFGAIALKDAKPDGYTLAQIHTGVVRAQLMAEQPAYNAQTDFTYIIQLSGSAHGIVVRADSPYQTLEELIAAAKANPGKLNYGTFGPSSVQNMTMVDLQQRLGIELTHVPYRGGSELYQGLWASRSTSSPTPAAGSRWCRAASSACSSSGAPTA